MAFDSLQAFMVMEGHGPYVWTCYISFFLLLGWLVAWSFSQRRRLEADQRRQWQLEARNRQPGEPDGGSQRKVSGFNPLN
ncbi:heme exporter protein CcmD [Marinobacter changyiensis]|uniref:heme exporter protein CcmD n=1 Tax=Marinobacter changyiensis TaxID=2604091 RepID=UPI001264CF10|nr:heme exporter protein CcmD [Marinobacter changyiensis]